jgi:ribosomal protein S18 acetylase RimI-like enzyme
MHTDALKKSIASKFHKEFDKNKNINFWNIYEGTRKPSGLVEIPEAIKSLSEKLNLQNSKGLENLFYKSNFKKYLFPETLSVIKKLKSLGDVKIFSLGNKFYQSLKIRNSGIEKVIGTKNVIIVQDKKKGLKESVSRLFKKYKHVIIVDDKSDVLESAFLINPKVITIWIKNGKYQHIVPTKKNSITYSASSISEALPFLKSFIKIIRQNKLNCQISVIQGIYGNYINQLIRYTKTDKLIKKFTRDKERFKSKKSFNTWKGQEKIFYTLTDSYQKLLGIIWFGKKPTLEKFPECHKYNYTFSIRLYSGARNKGLSYDFMKIAFDNFNKNSSDPKSFWLSTHTDNTSAIKLYQKFGFKEVFQKKDKILMIFGY